MTTHSGQIELIFADSGFRLQTLEVYNWGTFTDKIWKLNCNGSTALLTGENGSGKSTLVDAILTLLVPLQKRHYNQASGANSKKERSEQSYVLGAYGRVREEDEIARTQYLRTKNDYSVLLARFDDSFTKATVSLAQIFWHEREELQKLFLVSTQPLSIKENFSNFTAPKELKKNLKNLAQTEVFSTFSDYNVRFRKLLGLNSDTALNLFNQTVSIKSIGDLNSFIRNHMLDKIDVKERIEELRKNFDNLDRSYNAIRKAKEQLQLLEPIKVGSVSFYQLNNDAQELDHKLSAIPAFFATKKILLLKAENERLTLEKQRKDTDIAETERIINDLRDQEAEQNFSIKQDSTRNQIQALEGQIQTQTEILKTREKNITDYLSLSKQIGVITAPQTEGEFLRLAEEYKIKIPTKEKEFHNLTPQRDNLVISLSNLNKQLIEDRSELESLKTRKSQIPQTNLKIREEIAEALGIEQEELPFAGELIRVKPEESMWEGAIERVLRNFGLRILVSEEHYSRVNQYVSKTDLRSKVVYQKITSTNQRGTFDNIDRDAIITKLEIKQKTLFTTWLENELTNFFPHICTDDLQRFQREDKAVTSLGLIKQGKIHEKDDRKALHDRRNFILGWDNIEKIASLAKEINRLEAQIKELESKLALIKTNSEKLQNELTLLRRLCEFISFVDLDTTTLKLRIRELTQEMTNLQKSSSNLQKLQEALEKTKNLIKTTEAKKDSLLEERGGITQQLSDYLGQIKDCENTLKLYPLDLLTIYLDQISKELIAEDLKINSINSIEKQYRKTTDENRNKLSSKIDKIKEDLIRKMSSFKKQYEEETQEIDASIPSLNEFIAIFQRIEEQDLPKHEKRFKELLNDNVIRDIAHFKSSLERHEEDIKVRIQGLNTSLRTIKYTSSTYVKMNLHHGSDAEVKEFRMMLRDCLPDVGVLNEQTLYNECFERIRVVIRRLESEERWASKVTDVRQWIGFSASEIYESDNTEKTHYSDSSGLSGGQKAKLAYTILASAIAYQYGLSEADARNRSFRFVVVDEAFSKSDEANSRYAMELFKTLGLQLLVVTPLDKIHLVEPYILACHYVDNNDRQSYSRVINLTMNEYYLQKDLLIKQKEPLKKENSNNEERTAI